MTPAIPVPLSPLANRRDLGGIPVSDGAVRPGVLWRADDVARVDAASAAELVDEGLSLILDLRSEAELVHTGRGPLADVAVTYAHLPLTDTVAVPSQDLEVTIQTMLSDDPEVGMGRWYAQLALNQTDSLLRGFELIAATSGATVFHCTVGKDRTGVFAAALLSVLGASNEAIVLDYSRTNDVLPSLYARVAAGGGMAAHALSDRLPPAVREAPAGNMRTMLAVLDAEHGGVVEVLAAAGLDSALATRLRERLVQQD